MSKSDAVRTPLKRGDLVTWPSSRIYVNDTFVITQHADEYAIIVLDDVCCDIGPSWEKVALTELVRAVE